MVFSSVSSPPFSGLVLLVVLVGGFVSHTLELPLQNACGKFRQPPPTLSLWPDSSVQSSRLSSAISAEIRGTLIQDLSFWGFTDVFIIYFRETEHERGEGQRAREMQNPKQAPGSELSAQSPTWGSNSRTVRS